MTTYRAEVDEVVVFTAETDGPCDTKVFPAEFMNPETDTVFLYANDDIIGVQRPYSVRAAEDARRIAREAKQS